METQGENLTKWQRQKLDAVIGQFCDVLTEILGKYELFPFSIWVEDDKLVRCTPYQCSPPKPLAFSKMIADQETGYHSQERITLCFSCVSRQKEGAW
ncbi:hypothetical protein PR048_003724 [Dryococelus australis]|uniref:Uncharacterized protein n=1 Tax=Dryococelus australis TaxID=614101 RepID=A0ABQ9INV0_9NEOP|nr:hypothetical protein PR048_003724 [Dryococelus australis]